MKAILLVPLIGLSACSKKSADVTPAAEDASRIEDVRSEMARAEGWRTTFVSRGGEYEGMDSDSSISFLDGGRVTMSEYGIGPTNYNGTYGVDAGGVITLHLKNYPGDWPKMILRKIDGRFLLFRADGATHLAFGGRGGAVETSDMKPFWPFGVSEVLWPEPKPYIEPVGPLPPIFPPKEDEIEQVGADQPATRPESKPKSAQKPQPESEARPR